MREPTAPTSPQDTEQKPSGSALDDLKKLRTSASALSSNPSKRFSLGRRLLLPIAGLGLALIGLGARAAVADPTPERPAETTATSNSGNLDYDMLFDLSRPWEWSSARKGYAAEIADPLHPGAKAEQFLLVDPAKRPSDPRRRAEVVGPTASSEPMEWQPIDLPRLQGDNKDLLLLARLVTAGLPSSYQSALRLNSGGDGPSGKDVILAFEADPAGKFGKAILRYKIGGTQNRDNYLIDQVLYQASSEGDHSPITRFRGGLALTNNGNEVVVVPPVGFPKPGIRLPEAFYNENSNLSLYVGAGARTTAVVDQLTAVLPQMAANKSK